MKPCPKCGSLNTRPIGARKYMSTRRKVCLNRHRVSSDTSFCSYHNLLVSNQCCEECQNERRIKDNV